MPFPCLYPQASAFTFYGKFLFIVLEVPRAVILSGATDSRIGAKSKDLFLVCAQTERDPSAPFVPKVRSG